MECFDGEQVQISSQNIQQIRWLEAGRIMSDLNAIERGLMQGIEPDELIEKYGLDAVNEAINDLENRI
jgi:hypothetical protein